MKLTCLFRVNLELRIDTREGLTALIDARSMAIPGVYLDPPPPPVLDVCERPVIDPRLLPPAPPAGLDLVFFELDRTGLGLFDRLPEE